MIYRPDQVRTRMTGRRLSFSDDPALVRVREILRTVETEGDAGLDRIGLELDRHRVQEIPKQEWQQAYEGLDAGLREALETAKARIEAFYQHEPIGGFLEATPEGMLGQLVRPMDRVGIYIPGGSAPLLSSVLMAGLILMLTLIQLVANRRKAGA